MILFNPGDIELSHSNSLLYIDHSNTIQSIFAYSTFFLLKIKIFLHGWGIENVKSPQMSDKI